MLAAKVEKRLWAEAIAYAAHIRNRVANSSIHGKTPFELFNGRVPDISHIRIFGSQAWTHIPKERRHGKLNFKAQRGILVGYSDQRKAYRVFVPNLNRVIEAYDVKLDESVLGYDYAVQPIPEVTNEDRTIMLNSESLRSTERMNLDDSRQEVSSEVGGYEDSQPGSTTENLRAEEIDERLKEIERREREVQEKEKELERMIGLSEVQQSENNVMDQVVRRQDDSLDVAENREEESDAYEDGDRDLTVADGHLFNDNCSDSEDPINILGGHLQTWSTASVPRGEIVGKSAMDTVEARNHRSKVARYDYAQPQSIKRTFDDLSDDELNDKQLVRVGNDHQLLIERNGGSKMPRVSLARVFTVTDRIPRTVREAFSGPLADKWKSACQSEMDSLQSNETWTLVDLPPGRKPITCKWIFSIKMKENGSVDRYKARLVVRGFSQVEGIDYDETFAPVVRYDSIRVVLAVSSCLDYEIDHMDVATAFLNGELEEEIYMQQPDGYIEAGKENLVCKLKKSLYGLKQAPKCWNEVVDAFLMKLGFERSYADYGIYIKNQTSDQERIIIALYVDDLLIATSKRVALNEVKKQLEKRFKIRDLGPLSYFLGISVKRHRPSRILSLSQEVYISEMLKTFNMEDSKAVSTPEGDLDLEMPLNLTELQCSSTLYRSIVGSLMYAMIATRPDIANAVRVLSTHLNDSSQEHFVAAKRVLRYLQGTRDLVITYDGNKGLTLKGFSDSDWAGDKRERRSVSGYVFMLAGAPVTWKSVKQRTVALSSTEAEYMGLCEAAKEAVWLRQLLTHVGIPQENPTIIHEDNQGAIALAKNPQHHNRTKHIDIRFHYIRERVMKVKDIVLQYTPTANMIADIFTKRLTQEKFGRLRDLLNLKRYQQEGVLV